MIKIENTEVMGWEHAIRGMRNPLNSWRKSDSDYRPILCQRCDNCMSYQLEKWEDCDTCEVNLRTNSVDGFMIGPNDHELMMKLAKGGPVHAKYRRMITVYMDVTAPLYWWKEFDTYKVGTVANSCSTMHKIHAYNIFREDCSCEKLSARSLRALDAVLEEINFWRNVYINGGGVDLGNGTAKWFAPRDKYAWEQMIQLLPSSYNQKRTIMLNYEVLAGMYESRKNHKLDEWREFCKWIEGLPYSELIIGQAEEETSFWDDAMAIMNDMTNAQVEEAIKYLESRRNRKVENGQ